MKSKFTQFIMSLIIIAIMIAMGLIILIIFNEVIDGAKYAEETEIADYNSSQELWVKEDDNISSSNYNYSSSLDNIEVPRTPKTITNANSSNAEQVNVNYDNVSVNKYFYQQLNKYSQTIYKALESNKEQMKSGNYQVNMGTEFTEVLSKENGQEKLGEYYQSAIEAYTYDNPDVFYLNPTKMFLNIETTTRGSKKTYNVFINCGEEESYFIDEFSSKEEVDEAVDRIENVKKQIVARATGNKYQDIKMVHNYLVDNIEYEKNTSSENIYNICGALVNHRCVCEGYAKAFKYLMDALGIECNIVIGKATNTSGQTENHAWNYVKLNDIYYAIDVTWDDPIVIGGFATDSMRYKYFLKGRSEMDKDHTQSGKFTEDGMEFFYPVLSNISY